jgi:hypothetical protein
MSVSFLRPFQGTSQNGFCEVPHDMKFLLEDIHNSLGANTRALALIGARALWTWSSQRRLGMLEHLLKSHSF